jgi:4-hydroxy-4-methyl-2-oxoglutarate aldolase
VGGSMPQVQTMNLPVANREFEALAAKIRERLFVAVLSDMLDSLGYREQAFPPHIRCLDDELMLVGRARTGIYRDVYHVEPDKNPYELEIALVDDLKPGDVAVLACGTSGRIAPWGGLLTTACLARGAAGCVTDGLVRDVKAIRQARFPVFHGGIGPLDSKGRGEVAAIDIAVECAGVYIKPGDLIVGDADGIVAIPSEIEAQVLAKAFDRIAGENETQAALERGEKLGDVFRRLGVL